MDALHSPRAVTAALPSSARFIPSESSSEVASAISGCSATWSRGLRVPFEVSMSQDKLKNGREWHLEFTYAPEIPCPFPIVPEGTHEKQDAVGHLSNDGTVHVFNTEIIEQLVRAGLRMRASENEQRITCPVKTCLAALRQTQPSPLSGSRRSLSAMCPGKKNSHN